MYSKNIANSYIPNYLNRYIQAKKGNLDLLKNNYIYWNEVVYVVKNRLKEIRMREYLMDQKAFAEMLGIKKALITQ
ncbi:putative DNA-binding protein [Clostridium botulinum CFSAN002367]|nr:putative DNA-binding protein [Clostridium botulinum CFSAN002367]